MTDQKKATGIERGRVLTETESAVIRAASRVIVSETGGSSEKVEAAIRYVVAPPKPLDLGSVNIKVSVEKPGVQGGLQGAGTAAGIDAGRAAAKLAMSGEWEPGFFKPAPKPDHVFGVDFGSGDAVVYESCSVENYSEPASAIDQEYAQGRKRRAASVNVFEQRDEAREELKAARADLETSQALHKEALNTCKDQEKQIERIIKLRDQTRADLTRSQGLHNDALNALDARDKDLRAAAVILAETQAERGKQIAALEAEREQYLQEREELTTTKSYIRASELEAQVAGLKTNAAVWEGVAAELKEQNAHFSRRLRDMTISRDIFKQGCADSENLVIQYRNQVTEKERNLIQSIETNGTLIEANNDLLTLAKAREVRIAELEARLTNTVGQKEYDAVCNRVRLFRERMEAAKAGFESIGNDHTYHNRQIAEMQIGALSEALYNDK